MGGLTGELIGGKSGNNVRKSQHNNLDRINLIIIATNYRIITPSLSWEEREREGRRRRRRRRRIRKRRGEEKPKIFVFQKTAREKLAVQFKMEKFLRRLFFLFFFLQFYSSNFALK